MFDHSPYLGGGCLESSQNLLVQAILSLEEAHSTHQNLIKTPPTRKSLNSDVSTIARDIKQALDHLSKLYILLFGPQCSEDSRSFSRWITQNRKVINGFLGENPEFTVNKVFDIVLGEDGACGEDVVEIQKTPETEASPPQPCDTLMPYMPAVGLNLEIKEFRRILERRYESIKDGIPRDVVENVDSLEKLFHLTRDPTTDCIWNVDHQQTRIEVFQDSDVGNVYREKCVCVAAEGSEELSHESDPHCPKNKKDEDKSADATKETKEEKAEEEKKKEEEKVDPSEKIHSRELMAEILDMVGPQHVKDHFRKIKDLVSSSFRKEKPWEGKHFGAVLMGPASTGKDKIAKLYGKYLISCGIAKENRIEREASYIIENDKLEDYFKRLEDGGVLTIENAHLLLSYKHKDKLALNYLLEQAEKSKGKITLILHGEEPELREFLAKTKSTKLFPHILALNEFKGEDALTILRSGMENWFGDKTEVEGGWDGLYMRIAARRLAKKDGDVTEAVGNLVKDIHKRQRKRMNDARKAKGEAVDEAASTEKEPAKDETAESKDGEESQVESPSIVEADSEKATAFASSLDTEKQKAKGQDTATHSAAISAEPEEQLKPQSRASTNLGLKSEVVLETSSAIEVKNLQEDAITVKLDLGANAQVLLDGTDAKTATTVDTPESQDEVSTRQSTTMTPPEELNEKADAEKAPSTAETLEPTDDATGEKLISDSLESKGEAKLEKSALTVETQVSIDQAKGDKPLIDSAESTKSEKSLTTDTQESGDKAASEKPSPTTVALEAKHDTNAEKPAESVSAFEKQRENADKATIPASTPESKEVTTEEKSAESVTTQNLKDESTEEKSVEVSSTLKPEDKTGSEEPATTDSPSDSDDESDSSTDTASTTVTTPDTNEEKPSDDESEEDETIDPEDYTFTKDDILGPAPTNKVLESEAWKKLQKLTGLKKVKESLLNFLELAKANYQRELQEKPLLEFTFNRLFLGPPGTGKTVVARLYGQILSEIGVLSKGELIVKNASDLIGKYIGDSETNTREALKEADGNVLVIDEAYMLYTSDGITNTTDCFRQGIIDTLVGGIQNVPGEDRCVLLLGYEDQMKNFLTESNPGLIRRFPLEEAFLFEEFTLSELESMLRMKLEEYGLEATEEAIKVAMGVLDKARSRINFGNGGAVENLITKAKSNCLGRIIALPENERPEAWLFEPRDFDPEFDRGKTATANLQKLFSDVVGCEDIIKKFENYQLVCQAMKSRDMDPRAYIPTNFIFKGPPGTGKTTTARKIAQVYYDMGFLSEATVVECSVTDLIGQYVGQTGPKTVKALERGLGKVLFIDEAYRFGQGGKCGSFATEAVSELVDCLTKPKFLGKIIVILAGYEDEMNALLSMNPGLASRFPEEIMFDLLPAKGCLEVLHKKLKETGISMPLMDSNDSFERQTLERLLRSLSQTPSWGNARDVETLAKTIARNVFVKQTDIKAELVCTVGVAAVVMEDMLAERRARDGLINVGGMYY